MSMQPVTPTSPAAPWIGGKRNLAKRLTAMIDAIECRSYVEPFVGMGGIFLRRRRRPPVEVVNDAGRDVANLFRILQRHYPQFIETMRFQLTTRSEFERLVSTDPETLTDLERAGRFLYLQRLAFGGKVSGRNFGVASDRPARFNLTTLEPMLQDLHERLAGVIIERLDFEELIRRYDRPDALFYLDPPYWGSEGDYGRELFSRADFERLRGVLATIKGRFIMSLNDRPEVRSLFENFAIEAVSTTYTIASGPSAKSVGELIISSRELTLRLPRK